MGRCQGLKIVASDGQVTCQPCPHQSGTTSLCRPTAPYARAWCSKCGEQQKGITQSEARKRKSGRPLEDTSNRPSKWSRFTDEAQEEAEEERARLAHQLGLPPDGRVRERRGSEIGTQEQIVREQLRTERQLSATFQADNKELREKTELLDRNLTEMATELSEEKKMRANLEAKLEDARSREATRDEELEHRLGPMKREKKELVQKLAAAQLLAEERGAQVEAHKRMITHFTKQLEKAEEKLAHRPKFFASEEEYIAAPMSQELSPADKSLSQLSADCKLADESEDEQSQAAIAGILAERCQQIDGDGEEEEAEGEGEEQAESISQFTTDESLEVEDDIDDLQPRGGVGHGRRPHASKYSRYKEKASQHPRVRGPPHMQPRANPTGPWTSDEVEQLLKFVKSSENCDRDWNAHALKIGKGRSGKACQLYFRKITPTGPWGKKPTLKHRSDEIGHLEVDMIDRPARACVSAPRRLEDEQAAEEFERKVRAHIRKLRRAEAETRRSEARREVLQTEIGVEKLKKRLLQMKV
eukprot:COSAG01_NODE_9416_length_2451_cov_9.915816_1_plen_528_part_01